MSPEIAVLCTLLRFARSPRRLGPATLPGITDRLARRGEDPALVQRALASLARQGLVVRTADVVRLSLPGLAVAVACASTMAERSKPRANIVAKPRLPLVRRRRAA